MSVTDYRTITSSNPATLISEVNKLIKSGWQPLTGHVSGSYNSRSKISQVMVKGSGTSYTEYDLLYSSSAETLNIMVAASISKGWDVLPGGLGSGHQHSLLCQPMVKGTGVVIGAGLQPSNNLSDVSDKSASLLNLGAPAKTDIDGVSSFAALRSRTPKYTGERIWLQSWNDGYTAQNAAPSGGGRFIGYLATGTDDGGVIAAGNGFYWRREVRDNNDLNITHFGALPDGVTDCASAVLAMHLYTFNVLGNQKKSFINVPAGAFAISTVNIQSTYIDNLRISGPPCAFGFTACAKFNLIGADASYAFYTHARNFEQSNIEIDGMSPSEAGKLNRGFFTNKCESGQRYRILNNRVTRTGGIVWNVLDTLDAKWTGLFTDATYETIIKGRPSNNATGQWYHITAIDISHANFQNGRGTNAVVDLPMCTQSLMRNVWFEKCVYPADLSGGQWLLDAVSSEGDDATNKRLNVTNGAISIRGLNLQNSAINRKDPTGSTFLDSFNQGFRQDEAYGSRIAGTMAADWYTSSLKMNNLSTTAMVWYRVAAYQIQAANDSLTVRFFGARNASSTVGVITPQSNNFGGGDAVLRLRHASASTTDNSIKCVGAVEVHGTSPINDIYIERTYARNAVIYVQLPVSSGWVGMQTETTTDNRFQAGSPFQWTPDGTVVSDTDMAAKVTAGNMYRPLGNAALGNVAGKGIIINDDGGITLTTKDVINSKMRVIVNGTAYRIPLELDAILSDKFNRAGNISATTADNQLGGSGTYTWSTNSTGYTTETGSLNVTSKIQGAASLRVNRSDYKPSFILVSGPTTADSTTQQNATFDFRRYDGTVGADCYRLSMQAKDANGKTVIRLLKRVSSVVTTISPADSTVTDGQTITVSAVGSSIKVWVADVLIWDLTDTSLPTGEVLSFSANTANAGYRVSTLIVDNP